MDHITPDSEEVKLKTLLEEAGRLRLVTTHHASVTLEGVIIRLATTDAGLDSESSEKLGAWGVDTSSFETQIWKFCVSAEMLDGLIEPHRAAAAAILDAEKRRVFTEEVVSVKGMVLSQRRYKSTRGQMAVLSMTTSLLSAEDRQRVIEEVNASLPQPPFIDEGQG